MVVELLHRPEMEMEDWVNNVTANALNSKQDKGFLSQKQGTAG